jgi:hypothetical protein
MCGSPKPPAPPPDYSAQKAAFQSQQQGTYDNQAKSYNDAATAFNNNISDFGRKVSEGSSLFGNLSIAQPAKIDEAYNFWSGLKTKAASPWEFTPQAPQAAQSSQPSFANPNFNLNLNLGGPSISNNRGDIGGLPQTNAPTNPAPNPSVSFGGLTGFNLNAPNFQSVVTTPFAGQTVTLNVPSLVNPDLNTAKGYLSQVDNSLASIAALRQQRTDEQNRVSAFQTNYRGQLGDLEGRLGNLTIADMQGMNALEAELNRLENQRRGFTTALSGEYGDFLGFASPEQDYQDVTGGLQNLRAQRAAEEARINDFRANKLNTLDQARNSLGSLTIADIGQIRGIETQIDEAARGARRFSSALNPDFSREFAEYNDVNSMVDRLLQQRSTEESRIGNYEQQLLQRARMLESQAQRLGIADTAQSSSLQSEADALRREASSFSSQIGFDLSQELAPLDTVQSRLGEIQTGRTTEQARIDAYRNDLQSRLAQLQTRANSLTIADLDEIKTIDEELSGLDRESRNFRAELPFDFANLFDSYGDVDSKLADLYSQRNSEEQRVAFATRSAQDRANDLLRSATLSDFYDASRLDSLAFDIQGARNQASGFSSVLGANFDPANQSLSQAEARLAALRQQRGSALGDISGRSTQIRDALSAAPLQDEAAQRQQRTLAQQALNELAMFRGDDVTTARNAFSNILGLADTRASELSSRRTALETQARTMRDQLRSNAFTSDADLAARRAEIDAFGTEINDFRATQADDEMSDIYRILDQERGRISNDRSTAEDVARRERASAQQMFANTNMQRFFNQLRLSPTTNTNYDELLTYMNSNRSAPSPFARALMQAA